MKLKLWFIQLGIMFSTLGFSQELKIKDVIDVGYVPASFPAGFALITHGQQQFVAYYDSAKNMVVASRKLTSKKWQYKILDNKIGWDSHNYITMKIDVNGYIHVSGNMHVVPLIYYKSNRPLDIQSLTRVTKMVGKEEDRVTYPVFMNGPNGEFLYHYRYGMSGNGYEIYNRWDSKTQTWQRYLEKPLIDGKGERNAYMKGPIPGPDHYYHLIWVWRETPDCSTNHTLSYARSKDLLHWESMANDPVSLPMILEDTSLYVDNTPVGGGLINSGIRLGFDPFGKVLIFYHKYDNNQNTQLYAARYENGKWTSKQITHWNFRWIFKGGGSIENELYIDNPAVLPNKQIVFGFHRKDIGSRQIILDGQTLDSVREQTYSNKYPKSLKVIKSPFPGMTVHETYDAGLAPEKNTRYLLRWETLPPNRDVKKKGKLPGPTMLRLYKLTGNIN